MPVDIYECIDGDLPSTMKIKLQTKAEFDQALSLYFAKSFEEASKVLEQILQKNPDDKTVQLFLNKALNNAIEKPGEEWTGIEIMTVK